MRILQSLLDFFSPPNKSEEPNPIIITSNEPVSAFEDNESLISRLEFHATLQFRTPLRVLMLDGKIHSNPNLPTQDLGVDEKHGAWVPILKSWRELGFDISEANESTSASNIGYTYRSAYLPFLIAVRKQVESEGDINTRIEKLHIELQKQEWADFVARHQGMDGITNEFFPYFIDTLPGTTATVKDELRELGITTADKLSKTDLSVLLSIKGIGKVKAAALVDYAAGVVSNRFDERLENTFS
ncbi:MULTISPECIES: hypothetical protein [unclassified Methylophilus]|uniref:hypothetical protein n=1 Tax=unclassified Methylophilus TaxID=2630143 RepID=UPI000701C295|nr:MULTISPECIES: hypothetical protein [unclassified Methylophilus]KQT42228.1 hypothetical protein ASG34_05570 [Methylophilus sp. Leaf416]KQT56410.1 hypothetical protein ASG44_05545 [Methylophilus sp. Leaf459]